MFPFDDVIIFGSVPVGNPIGYEQNRQYRHIFQKHDWNKSSNYQLGQFHTGCLFRNDHLDALDIVDPDEGPRWHRLLNKVHTGSHNIGHAAMKKHWMFIFLFFFECLQGTNCLTGNKLMPFLQFNMILINYTSILWHFKISAIKQKRPLKQNHAFDYSSAKYHFVETLF